MLFKLSVISTFRHFRPETAIANAYATKMNKRLARSVVPFTGRLMTIPEDFAEARIMEYAVR